MYKNSVENLYFMIKNKQALSLHTIILGVGHGYFIVKYNCIYNKTVGVIKWKI